MKNWVDDYLIDWHSGRELKIYRDFEVISFIGIHNGWFYTVGRLLDINLHDIITYKTATEILNELIKLIPKDEDIYITSTPIEQDLHDTHFYKLNLPLRIDYAIQVGLGVARSVTNYKEYCLYPIAEDLPEGSIDKKSVELLRLKLYAQLIKGKEHLDTSLQKLWRKDKRRLKQLLFADIDKVEQTFDAWFLTS
ncbi:hypothetical protein SAMN05421839_10516 [Halolactibacillus halophilus]|uniref:Uncharacterized protein n=1 Tax=Halolactibacillus halophilus TaxID=306540 RepID=A0A1I5MCC8_9BACI|nr:hypothetical protein [Halolactibacillus halophilus]GEM02069.1 hypothetical protein HHA03_16010 [Halolactibacillus halophilus]SFP07007.1 hypothetical protein SAMN05421839_10516 [Halolactibacillus halophilus]